MVRQSPTSGKEPPRGIRSGPNTPVSMTSRSGCANGSGRSIAASSRLNIIVLAPIPIVRVRMTDRAYPGRLISVRRAIVSS